ncbi:hypothetical protein MPLDJ20_220006 [Mesorhizobium plurifarium]|uniref:Uncharacterized protein n=1 Tax=Mesorhizobium plurifarium TaxID=69974 RepID=A0A090F8I8_MESPL|nr:hypothetical protein MPLDJ20_220006 [Mesorhizobium plurifarium]
MRSAYRSPISQPRFRCISHAPGRRIRDHARRLIFPQKSLSRPSRRSRLRFAAVRLRPASRIMIGPRLTPKSGDRTSGLKRHRAEQVSLHLAGRCCDHPSWSTPTSSVGGSSETIRNSGRSWDEATSSGLSRPFIEDVVPDSGELADIITGTGRIPLMPHVIAARLSGSIQPKRVSAVFGR